MQTSGKWEELQGAVHGGLRSDGSQGAGRDAVDDDRAHEIHAALKLHRQMLAGVVCDGAGYLVLVLVLLLLWHSK